MIITGHCGDASSLVDDVMAGVELPEELPAVFTAAMEADGERLAEAMSRLEQMPQVRIVPSSLFDRAKPLGSVGQQRGVVVKLTCCKKPIDQKCNDYDATDPRHCPTFVEAAQLLCVKVQQKHSSAECLAKAQEAMAAAAAAGSSSGAPTERTLAQLMANQLAIQRAHRAVQSAEQAFSQTAEAERVASERRAAAAHELEEVGCLPIAFLQITNDKKHDLYLSSAFATKRQEFFQKWQESGHASAVE
jgi:hypothetical protein